MSALLLRDIRLAARAGGSAMLALAFFAAVATLVPLGVGADLSLLARIAPGVLWVAAVLAALLALDRLFQADFEDGSLDVVALSPLSLEGAAAAKIAAHWLTTGLPLTLLSPLLGVLFGLKATGALFVSLLVGTPSVSAIGAIGAGLTLSIRRGGLIPAPDRAAAAGARGDLRCRRGRKDGRRARLPGRVLLRRLRAFALCHRRRGQAQSRKLKPCCATPIPRDS